MSRSAFLGLGPPPISPPSCRRARSRSAGGWPLRFLASGLCHRSRKSDDPAWLRSTHGPCGNRLLCGEEQCALDGRDDPASACAAIPTRDFRASARGPTPRPHLKQHVVYALSRETMADTIKADLSARLQNRSSLARGETIPSRTVTNRSSPVLLAIISSALRRPSAFSSSHPRRHILRRLQSLPWPISTITSPEAIRRSAAARLRLKPRR